MKVFKLVLVFLLVVGCRGTLTNSLPPTRIVALKGDVFVLRQGVMLKAEEGMVLQAEDLIKTSSDAFAQIQFNNNSLIAGDDSVVSLGASASGLTTRIIGGNVVFKIEKMSEGDLTIQTPTNQFKVRGTEFVITVDGNGSTLAVTSGAVEVFDAKGEQSLGLTEAGRQKTLDKSGAVVKEQEINTLHKIFIESLNSGMFKRLEQENVTTANAREENLFIQEQQKLQQQLNTLIAENRQQQSQLNEAKKQATDNKRLADAAMQQYKNERILVDKYKTLLDEAGVKYPE